MQPLTADQIRSSFVNTTVRETRQAGMPDLEQTDWDRREYLGWQDSTRPQLSYVVIPMDDGPVGLMLRTQPPSPNRRRMMCAWCQDITLSDPAVLYVARRAGTAGRRGDSVGTAICADFGCSRIVRRMPSITEMSGGSDEEKQWFIDRRIQELGERTRGFVREVLGETTA